MTDGCADGTNAVSRTTHGGEGERAVAKQEMAEQNRGVSLSPDAEQIQSGGSAVQNNVSLSHQHSLVSGGPPPLAQFSQANIPIPIMFPTHTNAAFALPPPPMAMPLFPAAAAATVATASASTHNLIPAHMQASALAAPSFSLNGTPGYQPAFIHPTPVFDPAAAAAAASRPILTVQDRPMIPPVYNGVHPQYPGLQVLHAEPPVFCVQDFLTPQECDFLIHSASDCFTPAPVVGKGAGEVSSSRTSSTCYLAREDLPDYMRKVSLLTGKPVEHCELPQVGRYLPSQQYLQHFDAFDLSNEDGRRFAANGGQRTVTVLVYLNNVEAGGHTSFPALNLSIKPKQGMAVVFFPATVDGLLDKMALHAALPAAEGHVKYVSQVWIRQEEYQGQPSKRLPQTLGVPFGSNQPLAPPTIATTTTTCTPMTGISFPPN